jgi:hypothetical protein
VFDGYSASAHAGADLAAENARLRRENERLRMEREIQKNAAHFHGSAEMKFRLIADQRETIMCDVMDVSPAGYYGIAACVLERRGDPACPPSPLFRQARSLEAAIPSSWAIWLKGRPLLASSPNAPRLNSSVNLHLQGNSTKIGAVWQKIARKNQQNQLVAGQFPTK